MKLDHEFIGRAAHEAEAAAAVRSGGSSRSSSSPDPDDPADVIGDEPIWHDGAVVGWVTSGGYGHHVEAVDRARVRADRARHAGRPGRPRFRDRDHRPAPAGPAPARAAVRPAGAPDAPVTEVGGGAPRRRSDRRRRPAGRVRGGRLGRDRDPARRRGPGPRRDAVPRRRLRELPRRGRRRRLRPDVPDGGPARVCGSPGIRPTAMPPLPVVAAADLTAPPLARHGRAAPSRGGRRGHRRRVERAGRGRRGGTGGQVRPRPRRARRRRGRRDLRRAD